MPQTSETRRASRIAVHLPVVVEALDQSRHPLHPNLESVYQRVAPAAERVGEKLPGTLRDLSTNGAFVACYPLPLLSRVAFSFELEGFGRVDVLGWTLWRRERDCELPGEDGETLQLPAGFGVLFEAVPLDARIAIQRLVLAANG